LDVFTVVWVAVFVVGGVTELVALLNRRDGDTLSEHVWRVFRVRDPRPTPVVLILRGLMILVLIWLTGHFGMGWWTLPD
jgi:hypothetical protein